MLPTICTVHGTERLLVAPLRDSHLYNSTIQTRRALRVTTHQCEESGTFLLACVDREGLHSFTASSHHTDINACTGNVYHMNDLLSNA